MRIWVAISLPALVDQSRRFHGRTFEDARGFGGIEPLERGQEKGDARTQRDRVEIAPRAMFIGRQAGLIDMRIDRHRAPDLEKGAVERGADIGAGIESIRVGDDRLKRGKNIGIATRLVPRQGTGKPAEIGNVTRDGFGN